MVVGVKGGKRPVSERALLKRVNRRRASNGHGHLVVRKDRRTGAFYTVDLKRNVVQDPHVDLEALARSLRVLEPFEALARAPEAT